MQILTVLGSDIEAGAHILIHELVIEDFDLRVCAVPGTVLKHCRWGTTSAVNNYMRRIPRGQPAAFKYGNRITTAQRTKNGCQRRLSSPIFSVDQHIP